MAPAAAATWRSRLGLVEGARGQAGDGGADAPRVTPSALGCSAYWHLFTLVEAYADQCEAAVSGVVVRYYVSNVVLTVTVVRATSRRGRIPRGRSAPLRSGRMLKGWMGMDRSVSWAQLTRVPSE